MVTDWYHAASLKSFLCLSRRLWEAGQRAEGQGVVGVVGAAHVKGIQSRWAQAGSPETARQVAEYCGANAMAVPLNAGPWINLAAGICSLSAPICNGTKQFHDKLNRLRNVPPIGCVALVLNMAGSAASGHWALLHLLPGTGH